MHPFASLLRYVVNHHRRVIYCLIAEQELAEACVDNDLLLKVGVFAGLIWREVDIGVVFGGPFPLEVVVILLGVLDKFCQIVEVDTDAAVG